MTIPAGAALAAGPARTRRVDERTLPLLAVLLGFGALLMAFAFATVHRRSDAELDASAMSARARYEITHWLEHGYFDTAGLLVRPDAAGAPMLYRSSTGAVQVPAYVVQKLHHVVTGRPHWRMLPVTNQLLSLFASSLVALLGYRLARRSGVPPLHALALAACVLAAHFTFPDNLMTFWEMSGRVPFLVAACTFLLLQERRIDQDSRGLLYAQAGAACLVVAAEVITGTMFMLSYAIVSLLSWRPAPSVRHLLLIVLLPVLLVVAAHALQIAWASARHPEMVVIGSGFAFRSGLDGSVKYYVDHFDIAFGREAFFGSKDIYQWRGMFLAGCGAMLVWLIAALRGRVPPIATISVLSLLGTYVLHAAIFSQAVMIHPYYYDVLLYTPLAMVLLVLLPSLLYAAARQGGAVIVLTVFLTVFVGMMQLRKYAVRYPQPATVTQTTGASFGIERLPREHLT